MSDSTPYLLSAQLHGHTADVRGVATAPIKGGNLILSGSRDGTSRLWYRPTSEPVFTQASELAGHQGFVNAVTFWKHSTGSLYAATAGQDKTIRVHSVAHAAGAVAAAQDPATILTGHTENVCALSSGTLATGETVLVSASWDKTAKVWREDGTCIATLKGHQMAVWAVLVLPSGQVVTAAADKTIRLWDPSRPQALLAVFMGHEQPVRGLTSISPTRFASCANDGTVAVYDLEAVADAAVNRPVQTLSGHTSFVYSLALIPGSGEFVSSGEDRSIRIWSATGAVVQILTLPAISVWTVAVLPDGDLVTGSNDGVVRVFSRNPAHKASEEETKVYEASVASQELNKAQIGDVKVSQLPTQEALQTPGTSEGEVKMVRSADGSKGEAYQWSMGSWQKVGDVLGGVGKKQKQLFDGKEWDYVFDVDVQEGAPPLKLPYNLDENAYFAAQRFLERNKLPASFLEQVVQFIDQNTESGSTQAPSGYADPYTGGSSYNPSGSSARGAGSSGAGAGGYVDPFTGGGSYRPGASSSSAPVVPGADPYTGVPLGRPKVFPQKAGLKFTAFNPAPVKTKLASLAAQAGAEGAICALNQIIDKVGAGTALSTSEMDALETKLGHWPSEARFPLIDTYRRAVLSLGDKVDAGQVSRTVFGAAEWGSWGNSAPSKVQETNATLALRTVANALATSPSTASASLASITELILASESGLLAGKNARVAFATVVLNLAVALDLSSNPPADAGSVVLQLTTAALASEMERGAQADSEAAYRLVVAAGSLATGSAQGSLPVESVMVAKEVAIALAQQFGSEVRFVDAASELKAL